MTLLAPAALAAFAGAAPDHPRLRSALVAAEALAAARIGTASLIRRSVSCAVSVPHFRRRIELPEGPLSDLTAVDLNGESLDPATLAPGPWWLGRAGGFPAGAELSLDYVVGWEAEGTPALPASLHQALLLIAADQLARGPEPSATQSRLGDHAVTWGATANGLPQAADLLLQGWRRP
ncbi:hypothetical protein [Aquibaculum arenosum]|uniref:Uncharacterized protein n=1 Tax=Aquibaculum arenosum TaxID=3032591 RepID=A0ABT5YQQ7_9PROT|nr:hypothetical protein [Fodinicurvata sp. CAU 1616]MDF2097310.1 hypothetical protein [Fodinicurvata sp. CAU 1616]